MWEYIHIDPCFLNLGTNWMRVVSFTPPASLPHGENPPVPIGKEAGWDPESVWPLWRTEIFLPYRDSNSDPSIVQPVASRYTDCAISALSYLETAMCAFAIDL
jgi:hypothetical protein